MQSVTVHDASVPALGLGTARMKGRECREAVRNAIESGYRHLDTAQMYENEDAVGAGIEAANIDRSEVFVVTKIDRGNMAYDDVLSSVRGSLRRLDVDAVDLLLIHAPSRRVPIEKTIDAMNQLQADGRVRHIGVSNFSVSQTETAIGASETPIITNQVEYNPFHRQDDLLEFCVENDVILTAYTPLANGRAPDDETLSEIGERYGKTGAQVALRWLIQQPNVVAIPKASDPVHRKENLDIFDFELTEAEMERIFGLKTGVSDWLDRWLRR